jgi:hypothetical protein
VSEQRIQDVKVGDKVFIHDGGYLTDGGTVKTVDSVGKTTFTTLGGSKYMLKTGTAYGYTNVSYASKAEPYVPSKHDEILKRQRAKRLIRGIGQHANRQFFSDSELMSLSNCLKLLEEGRVSEEQSK